MADLNGDGIEDLASGQYSPGIVSVWYGVKGGFGKKTTLEESNPKESGSDLVMATANFVDWDGDGDLDMVVGNVRGGVMLNINEGTKKEARFGRRKPLMVDDKPMKGAGKTDPLAVDWDGDGDLDILAGTEAGDVFFFRRKADGSFARPISALNGKARPDASYGAVRKELAAEGIDLGYRLRIDVADWNGDGLLDLLVGNCRSRNGKTIGKVRVFLRKNTSTSKR